MKKQIIPFLGLLFLSTTLFGQDNLFVGGLQNRSVHSQDSLLIITRIDMPFTVYAANENGIVTDEAIPALLSIIEDTVTSTGTITLAGISLFPNPTHDVLILQRDDISGELDIHIIDAKAQLIRKINWPEGVSAFQSSIRLFPPGTYFVTVTDKKQMRSAQFKILKL